MSPGWSLEEQQAAPGSSGGTRPPAGMGPPAATARPEPQAGGLLRRLGFLLAGLLTLGLAFATFNPWFGFFLKDKHFDAHRWPWELFQGPSGPTFSWLPAQVYLVSMIFAGMALLACAFLRAGALRAALALTALVLIAVVLMPGPGEYMLVTGMHTALALLTAGVWAGSRTPQGARLTLPALLALLALVFLPFPDAEVGPDGDPSARTRYISPATLSLKSLADVLGPNPPPVFESRDDLRPMHLGDWARRNLLQGPLLLATLVGLLALLGWGGCWAAWAMTLLLLTTVLGPPIETGLRALAEFRANSHPEDQTTVDVVSTFARNGAEAYVVGLRAACLPMALGVLELLRRRPAKAG